MPSAALDVFHEAALANERRAQKTYDAAASRLPEPNLAVVSAAGPALRMLGALAVTAERAARTQADPDVEEFIARWFLVASSIESFKSIRRVPYPDNPVPPTPARQNLSSLLRWAWLPWVPARKFDKSSYGCDYVFLNYLMSSSDRATAVRLRDSPHPSKLCAALVPDDLSHHRGVLTKISLHGHPDAEQVSPEESLREYYLRPLQALDTGIAEDSYRRWRTRILSERPVSPAEAARRVVPAALDARAVVLDAAAVVMSEMGPRTAEVMRSMERWSGEAEAVAREYPGKLLAAMSSMPSPEDLAAVTSALDPVSGKHNPDAPDCSHPKFSAVTFAGCVFRTTAGDVPGERRGSPIPALVRRISTSLDEMRTVTPSDISHVSGPATVNLIMRKTRSLSESVVSECRSLWWHLARSRSGPGLWL